MWKPTLLGMPRCLSLAGAQHQPPCSEAKRLSKVAHSPGQVRLRLRARVEVGVGVGVRVGVRVTLGFAPSPGVSRPPPPPCARLQLSSALEIAARLLMRSTRSGTWLG